MPRDRERRGVGVACTRVTYYSGHPFKSQASCKQKHRRVLLNEHEAASNAWSTMAAHTVYSTALGTPRTRHSTVQCSRGLYSTHSSRGQ